MKKVSFVVGVIIAVGVVLAGVRFIGGGPEDDWICTASGWVKHGNPSAPMPVEPCGSPTPVISPSPAEMMEVQVFFNSSELDPEASCNKVFPVKRQIEKTEAIGRAALEELLKGPTQEEKDAGYFTSINPGVKIQKLIITDGVAKVDFDKQLEFQVGGSCRVAAIRAEIIQTLKQFPTVNDVIISIDGRTEDILQP